VTEIPNIEKPQKPAGLTSELFSQANITTALAVFAVVLAGAPYVAPQVQSFMVQKGLMNRPAILEQTQQKADTQKLEQAAKEASTAIRAHHDSIFNDKADPTIGSGPIKVIEFLDYQCAYCRAASPAIREFLEHNPDVTLVVKEYPVIHPPSSQTLAAYGIAAYQGGKYADVHYAFLTDQIDSQQTMDALLARAGIDPAQAKAVATSQATIDHINKTIKLGGDLGVNGTPTFIVGDQMVTGMAGLTKAVEAERAKQKKGYIRPARGEDGSA